VLVDHLYQWTDEVLFWSLLALRVWAFADCLIRKAAAFPAVDNLSKPAWLGILAFAGALGTITQPEVGIISLISVIVASVYLADVRPAVRDVSDGNSRW